MRTKKKPVKRSKKGKSAAHLPSRNTCRPGMPEEQPNPRWNLWEEGVSSSSLGKFMECREQFRLEMVEGWRSHATPLPLAYGTCVHWILEQVYALHQSGELDGQTPDEGIVRELIRKFEGLWDEQIPNAPQYQREIQQKVYGLAEAQLPRYMEFWREDFTQEFPESFKGPRIQEWVGLETRFSIPYTFSDGAKINITGTRDGVFKDPKGRIWNFDTKCRSMINEADTLETLPLDLQQMLYLWANWQEYGTPPSGTVMNIVRRPGHRQLKNETDAAFYDRVAEDINKPKRGDHFFMRFEMFIAPSEIEHWFEHQLVPLMDDVRAWWEGRSAHYLNPNALISKYGKAGMYRPIVLNDFSGCYQKKQGTVMDYQTSIA